MDNQMDQERYTFEDSQGGSWDVTLNMAAARRVDLSDFSEVAPGFEFSILRPTKDVFARVLSDSPLMFAVIWAVVQPQVKTLLGIDPKEDPEGAEMAFLERLDGPAIERAKRAFWGALASFFPDHKTALLTLVERLDKANRKIGERIKLMAGDLDKMLDAEIEKEMVNLKKELDKVMDSTQS